MSVGTAIIGEHRVLFTTFCPTSDKGLAACEFMMERVAEVFARPVTETEFRSWLIGRDPAWQRVFDHLDAGGTLASPEQWAVDPTNWRSELHILEHLRREAGWQRRA